MKSVKDKPAGSWPPAKGCDLSFKNPYKLYGTMMFESVHSADKLSKQLPKDTTLLDNCLSVINSSLKEKLELFKRVESILGGLPEDHPIYAQMIEYVGDIEKIPSPDQEFD